ncbi:MAG: ABC transporter ATP-binding protein, partial [Eggerthellaceae bacterium]|nr:ABC transporter ATP-binding protein [Eggerthellaceae bacterium]
LPVSDYEKGSLRMSLQVDHLSFSYGSHVVLDDISFEVPDGMLVNVLGHNGVGKSTLFRCILGLEDSWTGSITINGKDARSLSIAEYAREMAYIPQTHSSVYAYEVIDVVLMSTTAGLKALAKPGHRQLEFAYECLDRVGIADLADRPYTNISGGEQQLVLIARALAQRAQTIIMDEPTSALDYGNQVRVLSQIKHLAGEGYTIIESTHYPDQAFLFSDRTLVLNDGTILCYGDPKDTITDKVINEVYGVRVSVESLYNDQVRVCVPIDEIEIGGTSR